MPDKRLSRGGSITLCVANPTCYHWQQVISARALKRILVYLSIPGEKGISQHTGWSMIDLRTSCWTSSVCLCGGPSRTGRRVVVTSIIRKNSNTLLFVAHGMVQDDMQLLQLCLLRLLRAGRRVKKASCWVVHKNGRRLAAEKCAGRWLGRKWPSSRGWHWSRDRGLQVALLPPFKTQIN